MRIARITGTVTATVKHASLTGIALLLAETEDGNGNIQDTGLVVADTYGAGPGELVLLATGSAARNLAQLAGAPVDAAVAGIIDHVEAADD